MSAEKCRKRQSHTWPELQMGIWNFSKQQGRWRIAFALQVWSLPEKADELGCCSKKKVPEQKNLGLQDRLQISLQTLPFERRGSCTNLHSVTGGKLGHYGPSPYVWWLPLPLRMGHHIRINMRPFNGITTQQRMGSQNQTESGSWEPLPWLCAEGDF